MTNFISIKLNAPQPPAVIILNEQLSNKMIVAMGVTDAFPSIDDFPLSSSVEDRGLYLPL